MYKNKLSLICLGLMSVALVGCHGKSNLVKESELATSSLEILADESQKALIAQQSLKTAQAEALKQIQKKQARFNVDVVNVNYIGKPEVLLNSVANSYGYRYIEAGSAKTLPVVNFTNRKVTAFELVKDVAVFIDAYADINIDHQNKTLTLIYK